MKQIKKAAYRWYKHWQNNWLVATAASFFYTRLLPCFHKNKHIYIYDKNVLDPSLPKIAFVCDEMTWQDFKSECSGVFVTPYNWKEVFKTFNPDIFFCESAWSGITDYNNAWRGRIYKNEKIRYENRRELLRILEYCRQKGIPTVFWNKEDPTFFGNITYDFVDTALKFNHILTTAEECISRYQKLGHSSVHLLMFGFSPKLFFPEPVVTRKKKAVFAGSWYADQPERCREMEALFDIVLKKGIPLEIYDRQSDSANPIHSFPEKYRPYLHPKVPFTKLGDIFREAEYAININTVKDSSTMFARRVFEIMACGCIVITNYSLGLKQLFPDQMWYLNEDFNHQQKIFIREQNIQDVFQNHTCNQRLNQIMQICSRRAAL